MRSLRNSEIKKLKRGDYTKKKSFTVKEQNGKFAVIVSNSWNDEKDVLCCLDSAEKCSEFLLKLFFENQKIK